MIDIEVPGRRALCIAHLVLDYNGTLAVDGSILVGVKQRLQRLTRRLHVHVLTADTFGSAVAGIKGVCCELVIVQTRSQDRAKAHYVRAIGARRVACIGNGRNDRLMLRLAALGIAVIQAEGAAAATLAEADVVVTDICDALDLLLKPLRLVASLRR